MRIYKEEIRKGDYWIVSKKIIRMRKKVKLSGRILINGDNDCQWGGGIWRKEEEGWSVWWGMPDKGGKKERKPEPNFWKGECQWIMRIAKISAGKPKKSVEQKKKKDPMTLRCWKAWRKPIKNAARKSYTIARGMKAGFELRTSISRQGQ